MDILPEHLAIVKQILQQYLPPFCKVYAFGSRVNGCARKFSDLDLAIDNQGKCLSLEEQASLEEAFSESSLPYKVDLLDWNATNERFKLHIDNSKILLF